MLDGFQAHASPGKGAVIAGKYRLVESIGMGAMGQVWRGVHVSLGHSVAVKVLRHTIAGSPRARARFEREAVISAHLGEASRHIARVFDYGVSEDGAPFVVMELLRGETLAERIDREGNLSLADAAAITAHLCRALATAHKAGVLHRDLKPANVFLCDEEADDGTPALVVKLVDFGMAKMLEDESFLPTQAGEITGTPSCMSPEQITGGAPLDARADLWATAALVYRMVTGRAPFGTANLFELGERVLTSTPVPPSLQVADLPQALDAWMTTGLAKERHRRFQTATELADTLTMIASCPWADDLVARKEAPTLPDYRASSRGVRALTIAGLGVALALGASAFALRPGTARAPLRMLAAIETPAPAARVIAPARARARTPDADPPARGDEREEREKRADDSPLAPLSPGIGASPIVAVPLVPRAARTSRAGAPQEPHKAL